MPDVDPSHWLYRLPPDDWLAAADTELVAAHAAFSRHADRVGVTHCRRGAGMALNAVLWQGERPAWGRSYMDHVVALCNDMTVSAELRAAAHLLRDTPAQPPALVQLTPRGQPTAAARALLAAAREICAFAAQESRKG